MDMAQGLTVAPAGSSNTAVCGSCRAQSGARYCGGRSRSGRLRSERVSMRFGSHLGQTLLVAPWCGEGRQERTRTVCSVGQDGFFESNLVQSEVDRLQGDYQALLKLGRRYGQFDREGKKSYISAMKDVLERWQIFYKRMELSDDFTAKFCAKQLKSRGGPMGLSNLDLVQSLYSSLDELRADAESSP